MLPSEPSETTTAWGSDTAISLKLTIPADKPRNPPRPYNVTVEIDEAGIAKPYAVAVARCWALFAISSFK